MGNNTHWDEKHLMDKGFIKDSSGNWYKPEFKDVVVNGKKGTVKSEEKQANGFTKYEVQLVDTGIVSPKEELKESVLVIDGIVAGLNGPNGLVRGHWSNVKKQKDLFRSIIREQFAEGKIKKHVGKVRCSYVGYKTSFMDWDNFCASFKHIGDSLVAEGIIIDDNPKILTEFSPKMIKCKRSEQRVVIIIQDVI